MSDDGVDFERIQAFIKAQMEEARKQEDRFNQLMDEIFKLNPELVLMKLDLALRLHKRTLEISAELDGREEQMNKAIGEISAHVDKMMVENDKILRTELIKARARPPKPKADTKKDMDAPPGYT